MAGLFFTFSHVVHEKMISEQWTETDWPALYESNGF